MQAKNILETKGSNVVTVMPEARVADVARMFMDNRIGFALVKATDGSGFLGTVSERDIIHGLAQSDGAVAVQPVTDVLTANVVTCEPDTTVESMMETMTEKRTRHILVMDDNSLLGIVSIGDLIKSQTHQYRHEAESMRQYVSGVGYQ